MCNENNPINPHFYICTHLNNFIKNYLFHGHVMIKLQLPSHFPNSHKPLSRYGTEIHCDMK